MIVDYLMNYYDLQVSGSKRIQTFPPGYYSFNKFQQYERPPQRINREILRSLWHQACYGGDVDAAVRVSHFSLLSTLSLL